MALMFPFYRRRGFDTDNRLRLPTMYELMGDMDDMTGLFESPFRRMNIDNIENPFVTDESGNRMLKLQYDVRGYKPEEINIKTKDNKLIVHGKHVEEGPGRRAHSEFTRVFDLPEGMDLKQLKSNLSKDGVLSIEGPAPPAIEEEPKETPIPIQQEK